MWALGAGSVIPDSIRDPHDGVNALNSRVNNLSEFGADHRNGLAVRFFFSP
jgi:hypothetical protein